MGLERQSHSILLGKFGERFDGADESYRNAAGVITGPPSTGAPKDHGHSQGLTAVWIWYSQGGSSSSSPPSIPINSTGGKSSIVLTQPDRCNTRSNREEFIFKFISSGRIEMIIHSPKMPLGSREQDHSSCITASLHSLHERAQGTVLWQDSCHRPPLPRQFCLG